MKKIMFNDRYGLTQAVLDGKKTMTRREVNLPDNIAHNDSWNPVMRIDDRGKVYLYFDCVEYLLISLYPPYQIGEEVAVAQSYKSIEKETQKQGLPLDVKDEYRKAKGWDNKMFVRADAMPHRIRITNIKVERLQDISEEDCLKEGVCNAHFDGWCVHGIGMTIPKGKMPPIAQTADGKPYYSDRYRDFKFNSPHEAFAALIDRISGRGTWQRNPWVYAYTFELIK